jgi:two component regulator with propeller domain
LARIYSINEDHNGALWIGTVDAGVWRYDGTDFINYTTDNGLTSNAVNIIYKDKIAICGLGPTRMAFVNSMENPLQDLPRDQPSLTSIF